MLKKRNGFLLVGLLAAFLFALGCAGSGGETKKDEESTPRTLPAYNYSGKKIGKGASDMLITALFKTKKYRIYERNKLKSIMKEQNLQMSGAVDMSTAVQIGKLVGAKYIVTGAVTEFGVAKSGAQGGGYFSVGKQWYRSTVDVRAVSVQTGEIVFADSGSGALKSRAVTVLGIGGGESYDEKKATESMRMAIEDVMSRIYIELN
jgi:curli biogenesis system outer membrane secretion channel CsgG